MKKVIEKIKEEQAELLQKISGMTMEDVRQTLLERAEAEAQGLSMNDLVNNIFEEYLERKG